MNAGISLLSAKLGFRLFAYIFNCSDESAKRLLSGERSAEANEQNLINQIETELLNIHLHMAGRDDTDFVAFIEISRWFADGSHIFNDWRISMGGIIGVVESDDPIVDAVNRMASKVYPLFLIEKPNGPRWDVACYNDVTSAIYSLPESEEICALWKDCELLSKLLSNDDNPQLSVATSTGNCGGAQLPLIPSMLINNAFLLMKLRGELSVEHLADATEHVVRLIRSAAAGVRVDVPVFLGYNNVGLANGVEIVTQWGTAKPYNENSAYFAPNITSVTNYEDGEVRLGFIFEGFYKYLIQFPFEPKIDSPQKWPDNFHRCREQSERVAQDISICFSISILRPQPVGLALAWTIIFDPLRQGSGVSRAPHPQSFAAHYIIDGKNDVSAWCGRMCAVVDDSINLAKRRIVSAMNERRNPEDGFVDAIIAWENLFGGGRELSYRIAVSFAKLLSENVTTRTEIFKNVVAQYNLRSSLVHGRGSTGRNRFREMAEARDESVNLALDSLRILYSSRPDLITDQNRAQTLSLE